MATMPVIRRTIRYHMSKLGHNLTVFHKEKHSGNESREATCKACGRRIWIYRDYEAGRGRKRKYYAVRGPLLNFTCLTLQQTPKFHEPTVNILPETYFPNVEESL